jgi:1-deoxy-D-xylulose-5-phosphate reductoisomerase
MYSPISAQTLSPAKARRTKKLLLLGASGSIGKSTLEILRRDPGIELTGVSVHSSADRLLEILTEFPTIRYAALSGISEVPGSIANRPGLWTDAGEGSLERLVEKTAPYTDTVLTAVVGAAGIGPTLAAIAAGKKIALANKETLVTAGPVIEEALRASKNAVLVPVDSEHNALFQLLLGTESADLRRAILTASGGPFLSKSREELKAVTREEVLSHPTWSMGPKITVDSAGLINKGLEIIEAHHLFQIPYSQLDVLIHPVSHVHALVETRDGYRLMANRPSMQFPIAHSLYYSDPAEGLESLATAPDAWPALEFRAVDTEQFPGFRVCMQAASRGGTAPAILNASNEVAAGLFLDGLIQFTDIPRLLELVLGQSSIADQGDLSVFLAADREAREQTRRLAKL